MTTKKTQVIIPAAGLGERLQSDCIKPFIQVNQKPIVIHTMDIFKKCPLIHSLIVVVHRQYLEEFKEIIDQFGFSKVSKIVVGGETRRMSVSNGLEALDKDTNFVMIHDAARPLVTMKIVEQSLRLCYDEAAVIVGVPVKSTVKYINPEDLSVRGTLDRNLLWEIQTPQVFRKDIIVRAHAQIKDPHATDDSSLVERLGIKVRLLQGEYHNIKITTQEDVTFAQKYIEHLEETV